ncbi:MAG: hypothetical protein J6V39_00555 [Clostridia bacterium]|nr:hypothetical protein [Clostridia bacterium]
MKVFASLFSKSDRPSKGAQPLVASAEAKQFPTAFLVLFVPLCSKRTERNSSVFPSYANFIKTNYINHGLIDKPQNLCYNKVITREREIQAAAKLR